MTSCPTVTVTRHHIPFARPFRKRSFENDEMGSCEKRQKYYFFRLESETSHSSEEDTESVCSVQEKETDAVKDTSDTEDSSGSDLELEIEYEVASESDKEHLMITSSSDEHFVLAAAAAICNSAIEAFVTDGEESDTSSQDELSFTRTDFTICVQCKKSNDNPEYRYCEKCYQDRKTFFPPRPRRKRTKASGNGSPVAQNSTGGPSRDSGIGSSQEYSSQNTGSQQDGSDNLAKAVVKKLHNERVTPISAVASTSTFTPDEGIGSSSFVSSGPSSSVTTPGSSCTAPSSSGTAKKTISKDTPMASQFTSASSGSSNATSKEVSKFTPTAGTSDHPKKRKRIFSESSLSESEIAESSKAKQLKTDQVISEPIICSTKAPRNIVSEPTISMRDAPVVLSHTSITNVATQNVQVKDDELCIVCNTAPKNGIFLHGSIAHMCCCYTCAIRTWRKIKRCPVCSRKVNNVVKLYT